MNQPLIENPSIIAAFIALSGVIVGAIMSGGVAIHLARAKRSQEIEDKKQAANETQQDLIRLYSDPLIDATSSLKYRLIEILDKNQARYLLIGTPKSSFFNYKRISTLYRIAALLAWIRAVRRERSYLDPKQASESEVMKTISKLESALADGAHVELQRLEELLNLWRVKSMDQSVKIKIASLIDGERVEFLASNGVLAARDLPKLDQEELSKRCADIVRRLASVEIPNDVVIRLSDHVSVIFGIKEAYIYRDWQAAIGDLMLQDDKIGSRHFSVIGFGAFEAMFLKAYDRDEATDARRWLDRLKALVHDLDVEREGIFDARREQLRKLYQCCIDLEKALKAVR